MRKRTVIALLSILMLTGCQMEVKAYKPICSTKIGYEKPVDVTVKQEEEKWVLTANPTVSECNDLYSEKKAVYNAITEDYDISISMVYNDTLLLFTDRQIAKKLSKVKSEDWDIIVDSMPKAGYETTASIDPKSFETLFECPWLSDDTEITTEHIKAYMHDAVINEKLKTVLIALNPNCKYKPFEDTSILPIEENTYNGYIGTIKIFYPKE